jgi:hypothetical protein
MTASGAIHHGSWYSNTVEDSFFEAATSPSIGACVLVTRSLINNNRV